MMSLTRIWIIGFCLTCKCLCGNFTISGQESQVIEERLWSEAEEFAKLGSHDLAALAFEKIHFLFPESLGQAALLQRSYSLKAAGRLQEAYESVMRISLRDFTLEEAFNVRYERIFLAYLSEQFEEAEAELLFAETEMPSASLLQELLVLKILVANALGKYEEGKRFTEEYASKYGFQIDIEEWYAFTKRPKFRKPERAAMLSTFLPGAGQIYAGNVGKGFLSGLTQAAFIAYALYNIYEQFYITAFVSGFGVFQAFYFGGQEQAYQLAVESNQTRRRSYNKPIEQKLLEIEKTRLANLEWK